MTDLSTINFQITKFTSLKRIAPSPFLRNQMCRVIDLYDSVQETSRLSSLEEATRLASTIDKRWAELHSDMISLITVQQTVIIVTEILIRKLAEDYCDLPYTVPAHNVECIDSNLKYEKSSGDGSKSDDTTHHSGMVRLQLRELDLDTSYLLEQRFTKIAVRRGKPGNDIKPLIEKKNWAQLATALINDRAIAKMFLDEYPQSKGLVKIILKRIFQFETTYFVKLQTPSDYVVRAKPLDSKTQIKNAIFAITASLFRRENAGLAHVPHEYLHHFSR